MRPSARGLERRLIYAQALSETRARHAAERSRLTDAIHADGQFLGVAISIDPRTKPKILDGGVLTLEVGIGVDAHGKINRIRVYDYRGDVRLTAAEFLDQLEGRGLDSEFRMGHDGLTAVPGEPEESQLVANAGREALLLMKVALGRK